MYLQLIKELIKRNFLKILLNFFYFENYESQIIKNNVLFLHLYTGIYITIANRRGRETKKPRILRFILQLQTANKRIRR